MQNVARAPSTSGVATAVVLRHALRLHLSAGAALRHGARVFSVRGFDRVSLSPTPDTPATVSAAAAGKCRRTACRRTTVATSRGAFLDVSHAPRRRTRGYSTKNSRQIMCIFTPNRSNAAESRMMAALPGRGIFTKSIVFARSYFCLLGSENQQLRPLLPLMRNGHAEALQLRDEQRRAGSGRGRDLRNFRVVVCVALLQDRDRPGAA
jgi:hypothetical protein